MKGVIPPKSSYLVKVSYEPKIHSVVSVARFNIECQGGNVCQFEVHGQALSLQLDLSDTSINFGELKIGNNATKILTLFNHNDVAMEY